MAELNQDTQVPPSAIASDSKSDAREHGHISRPRGDSGASSIPHNQEHGHIEQVHRRSSSHKDLRPTSAPGASSDDTTIASPVDSNNEPVLSKDTEPFENGYHFPPKYSWKESTSQGLASFWKFFKTPMGFFWTFYGLNVVAWGGMLFLLLLNAAPAMCTPDCNDIDSPRRKWVEYDSQILTVLFCVTAFGLAPWRFRDLYYLLRYRILGEQIALRRLAGIHRTWFRLRGSQDLPVEVGPDNIPDETPRECVAFPENKTPNAPLTGTRALATPVWRLDYVIWCMVMNTFAQCALCGIMWGMNRYVRPSWTTGFLVAIASIIAMVGGLEMFLQGRKVKRIEGVPCNERDLEKLARDKEQGILHYNNLKGKKPKTKKRKGADPEADAIKEKSPAKIQQTNLGGVQTDE